MADPKTSLLPIWVRRLLYGVGAVFALCVIGILTAYLFLKSPFGEALVVDAIVGTLGKDGDISVAIGDIDGDLPSSLTLYDVDVRDEQGTWLSINRFDLSWQPWALLTGQVVVDALTADTVTVLRTPTLPGGKGTSAEIDLDEVADLLARARVDKFAVERIDIAATVIGMPVAASIEARLAVGTAGRPELSVNLTDLDRVGEAQITARLARDQTISATLKGALAGGAIRANGSFAVSSNTLNLKGDADLAPDILDLVDLGSRVSFDSATLDFAVTGPVASPSARVGYTVSRPRVVEAGLGHVDGTAELAIENGRLSIDVAGGVAGLLSLVPELAPVVQADGLYALSAVLDPDRSALLTVTEATIESGGVKATFAGPINLDASTATGVIEVEASGLGRFAGWSADQSQTVLKFDVSQASADGFTASMTGAVNAITADQESLTTLLAGPLDVTGRVTATDPRVRLDDIMISGINVALTGATDLNLDSEVLDADFRLDLKTLFAVSPELSGTLLVNGTATGPMTAPQLSLRLVGDQLRVGQESFEAADLSVTSDMAQSPLRATVTGILTIAEGPLTVDMQITQADEDHLRLAPLSVVGAGVSLQGALDTALATGLISGQVDGSFETLALPAALLAVPVSGRATATAKFSVRDDAQAVMMTATAEAIRYGGATAGARELSLAGDWLGGAAPRLEFSVEVANGFLGNQAFAMASASLAGPVTGMALDLSARAPDEARSLNVDGQVGVAGAVTTLDLSGLTLFDAWGELSLESPVRLQFSDKRIVTEDIVLKANGGRLVGRFNLDQVIGTIAATLEGENLPFDLLAALDPDLPVTGRFGLSVSLDGPLASPTGAARLFTTDFTLPDTGLNAVGADFEATLADQRLTLSGAVRGLSENPATINGSLPVILNLAEGQARVPLDQPADMSVVWAGAVEPVWAVLPLITHRMTGEADVDLQVTGTLAQPNIMGYARLIGGAYENLDLGTVLRELSAELVAESASLLSLSLSGTDGNGGQVSGAGELRRDISGALMGEASLTLAGARLVRRDDVKVTGSGTVTYFLTPDRDRIDGDIIVDSAEVSLTTSYVEAVPTLDVVDPDAPAPPRGPQRAGKETDLSVHLTAPRGVDVVGRGLESEWTADVALGGTLASPQLTGSLDVSRGEFSFLGELFELTQGQVLFTGGGQIDPDLSVVAARSTAGITARVEVSGRASAPVISLGSEPPLPQDEVLARIIFGKSAGQLGPLEAVQLANAAIELAGLAGRGGVVGTLRRGVGLDVFRFGSDAGGSTVVVGERLSKNVFVGVEQGLEGQGSQLIIEWQLTDNLGLKSTTRQDTGADIGLRWSRDY